MSGRLTVKIASVPDREELVAELWEGDEMWAELSHEREGQLVLEIYARSSGEPWSFAFDDAVRGLLEAKARLLQRPVGTAD